WRCSGGYEIPVMNRTTRKRTRKALLNFSKREHEELAQALRDGKIQAVLREDMQREKVPQAEAGEEVVVLAGGRRRRSGRVSTAGGQQEEEGQTEQVDGAGG